jgi:hypothetical protein
LIKIHKLRKILLFFFKQHHVNEIIFYHWPNKHYDSSMMIEYLFSFILYWFSNKQLNTILTYVIYRLKKSRIRVVFGEHDQSITTDGETVTRVVSSIVRHRNFDVNSYNHDVALLRLRKSVSFSKSVRPICLPSASTYTCYVNNWVTTNIIIMS